MKLPFLQDGQNKEEVTNLPVKKIIPNPFQPRTSFKEEEIMELAESIKSYGIIQPITVRERKKVEGYELIAGERRLRASKLIGMEEVPAVIKDLSDQEVAEIALVENLQRKDLNYLEEALAYQQILERFNLTQQELAKRIGKSQSTIANKLRLLTLPTDIRQLLNKSGLSERHARALLKIDDKEEQKEIIEEIAEKKLTVKETEKLIDKHLKKDKQEKKGKLKTVFKDLRIFTNTLKNSINEMKQAGLDVDVEKEEDDEYIEFKIRLPKKRVR